MFYYYYKLFMQLAYFNICINAIIYIFSHNGLFFTKIKYFHCN